MSWPQRVIAIVVGVIVGVAIVTAFVFELSDTTVDAPSLSDEEPEEGQDASTGDRSERPAGGRGSGVTTATVEIVGGAPPRGGPAQIAVERGERVRLAVVSDAAVDLQLLEYDISRAIPEGESTIEFKADRAGEFPLVVSASHIAVAQIRVSG